MFAQDRYYACLDLIDFSILEASDPITPLVILLSSPEFLNPDYALFLKARSMAHCVIRRSYNIAKRCGDGATLLYKTMLRDWISTSPSSKEFVKGRIVELNGESHLRAVLIVDPQTSVSTSQAVSRLRVLQQRHRLSHMGIRDPSKMYTISSKGIDISHSLGGDL